MESKAKRNQHSSTNNNHMVVDKSRMEVWIDKYGSSNYSSTIHKRIPEDILIPIKRDGRESLGQIFR